MKSSCSARGLSGSQKLPEIALILSVSLSSDTLYFRLSLYSSWSTQPHPYFLFPSPYWSGFTWILPVPSMSSVVSISTAACLLYEPHSTAFWSPLFLSTSCSLAVSNGVILAMQCFTFNPVCLSVPFPLHYVQKPASFSFNYLFFHIWYSVTFLLWLDFIILHIFNFLYTVLFLASNIYACVFANRDKKNLIYDTNPQGEKNPISTRSKTAENELWNVQGYFRVGLSKLD